MTAAPSSPKVSVLTPVYNVARYLPQCLESLERQTLEDIEFICINDGSTDESSEILHSFAARDPRFKVIDKANEGYGKTMNRGIAEARGEYVGILESDDFIAPDAFERLYALAKANDGCDVVKANYFTFDEKHGERLVENLPQDLCGAPFDPCAPGNAKVVIPTPAIWSAIYRRAFLGENGIRFLETPGAAFQDTGFVMKCFIAAERVYLTREAFVRYRVDNAGSSVKARDRVFNVCEEYHSIEDFLEARPEKRAALITCVNAAKFNTYRWNKNRIDWDLRPAFLEVFAREFRAARDAGELDESLSIPSRWKEFNEIADDPEGYYERTRTAHARKALAKKRKKAASPLVTVIALPAAQRSGSWRLYESLAAQKTVAVEVLQAGSLSSALPEVATPYVAVLDDPVWYGKNALDKLLAALEGSDADFAVARIARLEDGKPRKLGTSSFLFDAAVSYPSRLNAVDATLSDKLFRTESLERLSAPIDARRLYASLSFERVPKARVLTEMRDADLLDRVSPLMRVRYRRWSRKTR